MLHRHLRTQAVAVGLAALSGALLSCSGKDDGTQGGAGGESAQTGGGGNGGSGSGGTSSSGGEGGTLSGSGGSTGSAPAGFALIPAGTFVMGSPSDELERGFIETQHEVTLTRGFFLKETEVTQGEWTALMGNNPSTFSDCGDSCPVESLNFWDAISYANALSAEEGIAECYVLEDCTGTAGEEITCAEVSVNAPGGDPYLCAGYRLPTEAEWEYAYRAGTTTAFYNGDLTQPGCDTLDPNADAIGWYCVNSDTLTHPVAQKLANPWGLFDMAGNVWEWCWDYYQAYPSTAVTDPRGPDMGPGRMSRGGSRANGAQYIRAAQRNIDEPTVASPNIGLRLARTAL